MHTVVLIHGSLRLSEGNVGQPFRNRNWRPQEEQAGRARAARGRPPGLLTGVTVVTVGLFPGITDILGMLELRAAGRVDTRLGLGALIQNRVTVVAVLRQHLPVGGHVLPVVAAETPGRGHVADVVRYAFQFTFM